MANKPGNLEVASSFTPGDIARIVRAMQRGRMSVRDLERMADLYQVLRQLRKSRTTPKGWAKHGSKRAKRKP